MRFATIAALAVAALVAAPAVAALGTETGQQGPPIIDFGSPCFNGGITLIVYGKEILRCWKPLGADSEDAVKCASEVCTLANLACTLATKPVTKKDCVLVQ